jgi:hypothetical protein
MPRQADGPITIGTARRSAPVDCLGRHDQRTAASRATAHRAVHVVLRSRRGHHEPSPHGIERFLRARGCAHHRAQAGPAAADVAVDAAVPRPAAASRPGSVSRRPSLPGDATDDGEQDVISVDGAAQLSGLAVGELVAENRRLRADLGACRTALAVVLDPRASDHDRAQARALLAALEEADVVIESPDEQN